MATVPLRLRISFRPCAPNAPRATARNPRNAARRRAVEFDIGTKPPRLVLFLRFFVPGVRNLPGRFQDSVSRENDTGNVFGLHAHHAPRPAAPSLERSHDEQANEFPVKCEGRRTQSGGCERSFWNVKKSGPLNDCGNPLNGSSVRA